MATGDEMSVEDKILVTAMVEDLRRHYFRAMEKIGETPTALFTVTVASAFASYMLAEIYYVMEQGATKRGEALPTFTEFIEHSNLMLQHGMEWCLAHLKVFNALERGESDGPAEDLEPGRGRFKGGMGPEPVC